jgi:hypothetical protein
MTYRKRLGMAAIIIGLTLIVTSISGYASYGSSSEVRYGVYEGYIVRAAGDISLEVESLEQKAFSLYILGLDDVIKMIQQNGSMNGCTLLLALEDITSYEGVLPVLAPGWFAILTTPAENETRIEIDVVKQMPAKGILLPGFASVAVGILLAVPWLSLSKALKSKKSSQGLSSQANP